MKILCAAHPIPGHDLPMRSLALAFSCAGHEVEMVDYGFVANFDHGEVLIGSRFECNPKDELAIRVKNAELILDTFEPDIVIVDWRWEFWLAVRWYQRGCAVSIARCEQFIDYHQISTHLPDKFFQSDVAGLNRLLPDGVPRISDRRELLVADIMVVPSVPQLDPMSTADIYHKSKFLYTGCLSLESDGVTDSVLSSWLFNQKDQGRTTVLLTLGTVFGEQIYPQLYNYLRKTDLATIIIVPSERDLARMKLQDSDRLKIITYTKGLSDLLSRVDIVIHHCGHSTNQLVLLAGKPSITLSSGEYDREDNALRLQSLGCSKHLSHEMLSRGVELEPLIESIVGDTHIANSVTELGRSIHHQITKVGARGVVAAVENVILSRS